MRSRSRYSSNGIANLRVMPNLSLNVATSMRATAPAVVFSAGRNNRFGHPAPAVVARYRALHSLVFRTDEDGAIVLDTDGRTVQITTWSGRRITLPR